MQDAGETDAHFKAQVPVNALRLADIARLLAVFTVAATYVDTVNGKTEPPKAYDVLKTCEFERVPQDNEPPIDEAKYEEWKAREKRREARKKLLKETNEKYHKEKMGKKDPKKI